MDQATNQNNSTLISNPAIRVEINNRLISNISGLILTPSSGIQKIRNILNYYNIDIPALYELNLEGDEIAIPMNTTGQVYGYNTPVNSENLDEYFLYIIYYLENDSTYQFHAEIVTLEELIELLEETNEELDGDNDLGIDVR